MATKHIVRYCLQAQIDGEIAYDPTDPGSYTKALVAIDEKRKGLVGLGAKVTKDAAKPVAVRGE